MEKKTVVINFASIGHGIFIYQLINILVTSFSLDFSSSMAVILHIYTINWGSALQYTNYHLSCTVSTVEIIWYDKL